jgi:predicted ATPase with chaperone activity
VLFLDELSEFQRSTIDALRSQAFDDKEAIYAQSPYTLTNMVAVSTNGPKRLLVSAKRS